MNPPTIFGEPKGWLAMSRHAGLLNDLIGLQSAERFHTCAGHIAIKLLC